MKANIKNLILIIMLVLISAGLFVIGKNLFFENETEEEDSSDELSITLTNYEVYNLDCYHFILADFQFESNKPLSVSLSQFLTNHNYKLSDSSAYDSLLMSDYDTSDISVVFTIKSAEKTETFKVFIPFEEGDEVLTLSGPNDLLISFDLKLNNKYLAKKSQITGEEIKSDNYSLYISDIYQSTMMLCNNEDYYVPESMAVFTFEIIVNECTDNLNIEEAEYIQKQTGEIYYNMTEEYSSFKIANIVGIQLNKGTKAALFFEGYNSEDNSLSGVLRIKFKDSDKWLELVVE